jgi:hypothetical protein
VSECPKNQTVFQDDYLSGVESSVEQAPACSINSIRYRTHLGFYASANRFSIKQIKQRLPLAVAWSKVRSKFFTKLLHRSIHSF